MANAWVESVTRTNRKALGMLDNTAVENDELVLKKDREITMATYFGSDQMSAIAYYVSDLVAKGLNDKQILDSVNSKYEVKWNLRNVRVCKSLLRKVWRAETACLLEDQIAQELASLQTQEKEAWEAWEFSKRGIKHKTKKQSKSEGDAPETNFSMKEVMETEETTAGDIKFLSLINDLHKEKRKLLGLYAPDRRSQDENKGKVGPTAIQFNIVGGDASDNVGAALAELIGTPKQAPIATEEVQEAKVIESRQITESNNMQDEINRFYEELLEV